MINKFTSTLLLLLYVCTSAFAQDAKPLTERWNSYTKCKSADEAKAFINKRDFGSIYSFLQPGSELISKFSVVSEDVYGNSGRIFLKIYDFQTWIAFKKIEGNWVMTMDENELLEHLTATWLKTDINGVTYVSSSPLSPEALKEANTFAQKNGELQNKFGIKLPEFRYYYAKLGDEAANIVGEKYKGSGKARYHAIKAVECADHIHELVHIYAGEFGMGNSFIDEGVANCFGNEDKSRSPKAAEEVLALLNDGGYQKYLDGPTFNEANLKRKNIYAFAQLTMTYWVGKFGIDKIKMLLKAECDSNLDIKKYIENNFEKADETNNALREILNKKISAS
ncbi:hypothetical protein [uncultured Acetobacteroides sp.]|uniref:hypothetical protein n=1 Tax=uncultured Acetobacteroides sp. TaxID=1760811 RepID=UPI0029F4DAD0|nr:hypothetical protein [uncultured Acetobacteroides sp.]